MQIANKEVLSTCASLMGYPDIDNTVSTFGHSRFMNVVNPVGVGLGIFEKGGFSDKNTMIGNMSQQVFMTLACAHAAVRFEQLCFAVTSDKTQKQLSTLAETLIEECCNAVPFSMLVRNLMQSAAPPPPFFAVEIEEAVRLSEVSHVAEGAFKGDFTKLLDVCCENGMRQARQFMSKGVTR